MMVSTGLRRPAMKHEERFKRDGLILVNLAIAEGNGEIFA